MQLLGNIDFRNTFRCQCVVDQIPSRGLCYLWYQVLGWKYSSLLSHQRTLYVVRTLISLDNPAELTITVVIVFKYTFLMIYSLYSFTIFIFYKQILVCSVGILFQVIIG